MADFLTVTNLGAAGVNVDLDPLALADNQFAKTQNLISDPLGVEQGIKNRPGLIKFNSSTAAGAVLGGVSLPLTNFLSGTKFFFIGRGPTT